MGDRFGKNYLTQTLVDRHLTQRQEEIMLEDTDKKTLDGARDGTGRKRNLLFEKCTRTHF